MADWVVSATDAKRQFSRLLREVENGRCVTITRDGRPVAVLLPANASRFVVEPSVLDRFDAMTTGGLVIKFSGGLDRDVLHSR